MEFADAIANSYAALPSQSTITAMLREGGRASPSDSLYSHPFNCRSQDYAIRSMEARLDEQP